MPACLRVRPCLPACSPWSKRATCNVRLRCCTCCRSDEEEVLRQLDNFQRQTETIRWQLGGGDGGSGDAPAALSRPAPPGSSVGACTSGGSDWNALPESTPLRQQPTGLRGGGYTPHPGVAAMSMALFDGLPPSPAALAAGRREGTNRHVQHAGHHLQPSIHPQHTQAEPQELKHTQQTVQRPATSSLSGTLASAAPSMQQQPRSPIGLEVRHTKKSAAAAERAIAAAQPSPGAAAALQRLKTKRQTALGAPLLPGEQQQQQAVQQHAARDSSPFLAERHRQQDAGVQAQGLQHDEGVQVRQAAEVGVQAPTPPAPPQLPPDSNAALVAEVRQLRSKLLASLQKHAPELATAGADVGSSISALATERQAEWRRLLQEESADISWRLAAAPSLASSIEIAVPPASVPHSAKSASSSSSRLAEPFWAADPDWLTISPAVPATSGKTAACTAAPGPVAAGIASSGKYRLTDDLSVGSIGDAVAGGRLRLTDLSAATPSSLLGGGSSLAGLDSLEPSRANLGGLGELERTFDLGAFEAQTEALRARLTGL